MIRNISLKQYIHNIFSKTATYPTTWYANQFFKYNVLNETLLQNNLSSSILSFTYLQNTVSKVNIFYQELIYSSVSELPASSISDLISFTGGNLGLFLGMSLLTFIEMIDMVIQIIQNMIRKRNSQNDMKAFERSIQIK